MLFIKNTSALNHAKFYALSGAAARGYSTVQSWPDYLEHDPSKECVQVQRVRMIADPNIFVLNWAEVSVASQSYLGFRSGSCAINMAGLIPNAMRNWMARPVNAYRAIAAAVAGQVVVPFLETEWNFPEGLPMNPGQITMGVMIDGNGVANLSAYMYTMEVEYKWVKVTASDLQSFLGWENLGE